VEICHSRKRSFPHLLNHRKFPRLYRFTLSFTSHNLDVSTSPVQEGAYGTECNVQTCIASPVRRSSGSDPKPSPHAALAEWLGSQSLGISAPDGYCPLVTNERIQACLLLCALVLLALLECSRDSRLSSCIALCAR
jgi:hypothetical protein